MNTSDRTLWLGNIDQWMDKTYLTKILNELNIFPNKLTIKAKGNKRGCAFLEFDSTKTANTILKLHNNTIYKNFNIKLNWVKSNEKLKEKPIKFTVKNLLIIIIIILQLFVGNIDKSISNDIIKKYFYDKYKSIISFKIIIDQETKRSKGFGFIEFSDEIEFKEALNNKSPLIFGKQKLVFNVAKNRYDDDDIENSTLSTLNTSINHSDSSNSINNNNNVVFNNNKKSYINHFNDEEQFQSDLQKGFRDIINIYNNNINMCEPSNACNYYCNLSLIKNNKNNYYYNNNNYNNNNFVNYQKVFSFNNNNFIFSKNNNNNNNSFYNNCNNNCNLLNPPYFSYYNNNNFVMKKSENSKKNLNQRKNSN